MGRVRLTRRAAADMDDIWLYIARESVSAADRLVERIAERFRSLGDHPRSGVARPDIAPDARVLTIGDYLALYRVIGADSEIVRVVHGARRLEGLFGPGA